MELPSALEMLVYTLYYCKYLNTSETFCLSMLKVIVIAKKAYRGMRSQWWILIPFLPGCHQDNRQVSVRCQQPAEGVQRSGYNEEVGPPSYYQTLSGKIPFFFI